MLDIARQAAEISNAGLKARAREGKVSTDETEYQEPVSEWLEAGRSPADVLIAKYDGEWGGDIHRLFKEEAY